MEEKTTENFEVVFVLDRSGSMAGKEDDTIGGFNSLLTKQRELQGNVKVSTVLFDDEVQILHNRLDIAKVKEITRKEYFVRGCTAMWDAVGSSIQHIAHLQDMEDEKYRAKKTLFVITTDGMENASTEYTAKQVRNLIKNREKAGWEFMFLGANIDAESVAESIGIDRNCAMQFVNDSEGINTNFKVMECTMHYMREGGTLRNSDWKKKIEETLKRKKI